MSWRSPQNSSWTSGLVSTREGATRVACQYNDAPYRGMIIGDDPLEFATPLFLVQLILIFYVTRVTYLALRPLGQNLLISQIVAGIIIGPSILTRKREFRDKLFPPRGALILKTFGYFGFLVQVFGLGVNANMVVIRGVDRKVFAIGIISFVVASFVGFTTFSVMARTVHSGLLQEAQAGLLYLVVANSSSSFVSTTSQLMDLNLINSELGHLASSVAIVSDVFGWFFTLFLSNISVASYKNGRYALQAAVTIIGYYVVIIFVLRPLVIFVVGHTPEGRPMKESHFSFIICTVLCIGFSGEYIGQHAAFGAFVFGVCLPDGPPLGLMLLQKFDTISSGLLIPIFCTLSGLRTKLYSLRRTSSPAGGIVILMGYLGKFVGTLLPSISVAKMNFQDAVSLSLLLCCKGILELAIYNFSKDSQIMTDELFTLSTLAMVIVTGICGPLARFLYNPSARYMNYNRRTILQTVRKGPLKMIVCIHKEDNVPAAVNLIEASCPTRESPIYVFVLRLAELIGCQTAVLVPDNHLKKSLIKRGYSGRVVSAFNILEKNQDNVKILHFSAVAPFATMHMDICSVAHDKGVNIIIVPFHKQWGIDGTVAASFPNIRLVNRYVLDKAPCSVGVLIDRACTEGNTSIVNGKSLYNVVMLYIGGVDDHEALAYSRRMADHPNVKLTVIWIELYSNSMNCDAGGSALDREIMEDFFSISENKDNITLKAISAHDGADTIKIIQSLEPFVNLVVVGRHHNLDCPATSGLMDWCECPELGALGDILTSWDSRFSVLVVQQEPHQDVPVYKTQTSSSSFLKEFDGTFANKLLIDGYVAPKGGFFKCKRPKL